MHVAKGNKTDEFYVYDLLADTLLQSRSPIPPGPSGKLPYDGSRGIGDRERYIYMTQGRRTDEFWQYDAATNKWSQLPDIPELPGGRKATGCVDMAFVRQGDTGYVYLLEGKTCGFLRYDVVARSWQVLPGAPASVRPKYHEGSWLVYDGTCTSMRTARG
ncbi:hypothetical protein FJY69_10825, partial [candidate division WOR-3 bacterium]|nr:hypothetical protein [candidate division WOR-3 bacterium]